MATSQVTYNGNLMTVSTHEHSGSIIETDAPTDNMGKGSRFSPTDLLATALAQCIITTLAIHAMKAQWVFDKASAQVTKFMSTGSPRKVTEIKILLRIKDNAYTAEQKNKIKELAHTCPVALSLHPDLKQTVDICWE